MNWKQAKRKYEGVKIPPELDSRVREALSGTPEEKRRRIVWYRPAIQIAAACCALFVILVNSSEVFARSLYEVPVIGTVARVFTFREYKQEEELNYFNVRVPAIQNTGNSELEKRVNQQIQEKIDQISEEARAHARSYYEAFLATGGSESEFHPVELFVDYKIYYQSDRMVSFVLEKCESFASAYTERYYYNIDLLDGRELTLRDLLGEDFIEPVNEQVREQIREREEADGNALFFEDEERFQSISENQDFYVNEAGRVTVVFERYSIAPGYMGFPEFEIDLATPYTKSDGGQG